MINRRTFLRLSTFASLGLVLPPKPTGMLLGGLNLNGWQTMLGDGVWCEADDRAAGLSDIETVHKPAYSELWANVHRRNVMAHNITVKKIARQDIFNYSHSARVRFRLPYLPARSNHDLNGQTIEGGLFLWDGIQRRALGVGFQWLVNPWLEQAGDVRIWLGDRWSKIGSMPLNTQWHTVSLAVDVQAGMGELALGDKLRVNVLSSSEKPKSWTSQNVAMLQCEIVSLFPGSASISARHSTQFADWHWSWNS